MIVIAGLLVCQAAVFRHSTYRLRSKGVILSEIIICNDCRTLEVLRHFCKELLDSTPSGVEPEPETPLAQRPIKANGDVRAVSGPRCHFGPVPIGLGLHSFEWNRITATLCGPKAEIDRFGDAPIEGDERVIEQMVRTLGLNWNGSNLSRFRQRARTLVLQERRAIAALAEALIERRTMTGAEAAALVPDGRAAPLWVA
jgi:hypothetical protein